MLKCEIAEYSTGYAIYNACVNIPVSITYGLWIVDWVQNEQQANYLCNKHG